MLSTAPVFIAAGLSHLLTDHRQSWLALMFATTPVQRWRHCSPADDFSDFHQDCQSKMNPLTLYLGPWALGALGRWAGLEASHGRQFSKRDSFGPLKAATEKFFDKEHRLIILSSHTKIAKMFSPILSEEVDPRGPGEGRLGAAGAAGPA